MTMPREIDSLNMESIRRKIRWRGIVRLHQTQEDDESLLGEYEWERKSGVVYLACATTGLLFNKSTGSCLQSSSVSLLLDTLVEAKPSDYTSFMKARKSRVLKCAGVPDASD